MLSIVDPLLSLNPPLVILIFRTYALYNRNKYVLSGLVAWGLTLVAVSALELQPIPLSDAPLGHASRYECQNHTRYLRRTV